MAGGDLNFKTGTVGTIDMDVIGPYPHFQFIDITPESGKYVNNSLEGTLLDGNGSGVVTIPGGTFSPLYNYLTSDATTVTISSISRTNNIVTVNATTHGLSIGDLVKINGITIDDNEFNLNGIFEVATTPTADQFTYSYPGENTTGSGATMKMKAVSSMSCYDNRSGGDTQGYSFTSLLFSPRINYAATSGLKISPHDSSFRFSIERTTGGTDIGGLNSNIFEVKDGAGLNIKPAIFAYFFAGCPTSGSVARSPNNIFDIVFNSYAIVLRPAGDDSTYLEFALLKFSFGVITNYSDWITNFIDSKINSYTVNNHDLGYLIGTNPESNSSVTEIAKSNSFLYDSTIPLKFNLKVTIRKHYLTDSDDTYLVNLLVNDEYNDFKTGTSKYSSILHGFINRPVAPNVSYTSFTLIPYFYFKYANADKSYIGADASKIILNNVVYRQLNSDNPQLY